jgi:hypothetical protein
MNTISYDRPEEEWDTVEDLALPGRPRRRVWTWWSAGLFALILCAVGFYAGVRVEKGQVASSNSAAAFSAAGRAGGLGRTGVPGGGLRGAFGGAGSTFGTVSSVSKKSLFVTDSSGNTVKVTLSSATKVTKNVNVGKKAVRPGDLVVVSGAKGSNGTVNATTVSDTGSSPATAAGGGSHSSRSVGSAAVNQLFGGG